MLFGILRGYEINKAGHEIGQHALQMGIPAYPNCATMLSREIVLPATTRDAFALNQGFNGGSIPYGALMALPRNININSLGLSEPGRRLARAIQNYGVYIVDNAGCGAGALRADQHMTSQIRNQLSGDIPKIYRHMRMVLNNNVMGSPIAGGGQALAPNCAFDAGATTASVPQSAPTTGGNTSSSANNNNNTGSSSAAPSTGNQQAQPSAETGRRRRHRRRRELGQGRPVPQMGDDGQERDGGLSPRHARVQACGRDLQPQHQALHRACGLGRDHRQRQHPARARLQQQRFLVQQHEHGFFRPEQHQQSASLEHQQSAVAIGQGEQAARTGSAAAANWDKAVQFHKWAIMGKNAMAVYRPGTPEYKHAEETYNRNIRLYIEHAARAGITVTANIPPERAFG